jgi:hypothetical protein
VKRQGQAALLTPAQAGQLPRKVQPSRTLVANRIAT